MHERPWLIAYASVVVVEYLYIALPGYPEWSNATLFWVAIDALLIRAMARGSATAVTVSLVLAVLTLAILIVGAQAAAALVLVLMLIAIVKCGCLIGLLRSGSSYSQPVRRPA